MCLLVPFVHLVSCAQGLLKLNVPELKDYTENLKQAVNVLSSVKGNAKFLGSTDKFSGNNGLYDDGLFKHVL